MKETTFATGGTGYIASHTVVELFAEACDPEACDLFVIDYLCNSKASMLNLTQPPPHRQAVRWIAQLCSFIGRKRDGEPGVKTLWKGFQRLVPMAEMFQIMKPDRISPPGLAGND